MLKKEGDSTMMPLCFKIRSRTPFFPTFLNHKGICGERGEARTSHPLYSYDLSVVQPTKQENLGTRRENMPEKKQRLRKTVRKKRSCFSHITSLHLKHSSS